MTHTERTSYGFYQIRSGLADVAIGLFYLTRNIIREAARVINSMAHAAPWIMMAVEALIFIAAYFVFIAEARTQRDAAEKTAYHYQTSRDSLQLLVEYRTALWKGQ